MLSEPRWFFYGAVVCAYSSFAAAATNCTGDALGKNCAGGVIIPQWLPFKDLTLGERLGKAAVYFLACSYMFLGISVVADRFMASIEVITSQERQVSIRKPDGELLTVTVRIWNETVSNLTLMALGSSAPEILLSVIEVCGKEFKAGDLGPNTIVGSAAFNLFMIIAICVYVVPSNEVRRQKHLSVFYVTATWSLFAYLWLYFILAVSSYGVIDVWEGVVTLLFFPITVLTAYVADKKILEMKFLSKRYRTSGKGGIIAMKGDDVELQSADGVAGPNLHLLSADQINPAIRAFEEHRREFIELLRELRKKNPNIDPATLEQMAETEMINRGPKSRAFYRVQATRRLTGAGNIVRKKLEKEHHKSMEMIAQEIKQAEVFTCRVFFDPAHYTVLENVGVFYVVVKREGGPPDITVMVDYYTEDGTANQNSDYYPVQGTLTFTPTDVQQTIAISIIDDDVFEEDEHFYIHLRNPRVRTSDGVVIHSNQMGPTPLAQLDLPPTATVMILDDDHAGVFTFDADAYEVVESAGRVRLRVARHSGARGTVRLPYATLEGSARATRHFEHKRDQLLFADNDTEKYIEIGIVDDGEYEKSEVFYVVLEDPIWTKKLPDMVQSTDEKSGNIDENDDSGKTEDEKIAELGKPRLGDITKVTIKIKENKELKGVLDRMLKTAANTSLLLGTSSWREQFRDALTVSAGNGNNDDQEDSECMSTDGSISPPSWSDYVMHFVSVPWKLLFAFLPPTDYWGGWMCFTVSIMGIGMLTALVGDLASHLGCTIGLKDAVTAISFVALGTSIPDTFASKVAAIQDKYADSSIGNVTGSNGVNVFLGIGIAWTLAAVYHTAKGDQFEVPPGTLAFSVTVFCAEGLICIFVLMLRRTSVVGGELGGPMKYKAPTAVFLASLWVFYVVISSLESYCIIEGF